jgi:ABC-2 type transport system ATP-binding protein
MNVLGIKNLCKAYPSFALQNVSFSLEQGKITGFIGRNGAGKSTTLKSIFPADDGRFQFFAFDHSGLPQVRAQL